MTIIIVSYTPDEILFASDSYRYYLKEGIAESVRSEVKRKFAEFEEIK